MSEEIKKDLTGILEYSEKLKDAGALPAAPEGVLMAETPIESIDDFESLDDYARQNPAEPPAQDSEPGLNEFPTTPGGEPEAPMAGLELSAPEPAEQPDVAPLEFDLAPPPAEPEPQAQALAPEETPLGDFAVSAPGADDLPAETSPPPEPEPSYSPAPVPPPKPQPPEEALQRIKTYSERVSVGKPAVAAEYPFSLRIEGALAPEEKERLLDLLSRESIGVRDLDLEPQFESGRILIPRISEYAGVLLVMALRSARCKIRLAPSDEIFSTEDTRASGDEPAAEIPPDIAQTDANEPGHPAEQLPLTTEPSLPGMRPLALIDIVTASATLGTKVVEARNSSEYNELVEALQRELKYKAYRKGATAVVNVSIQLTTLSLPTHYRLMAIGSAVK